MNEKPPRFVRKREAVTKRVHSHLKRLDDPDLTNDVKALIHMANVEAAAWRHAYRNATIKTEQP